MIRQHIQRQLERIPLRTGSKQRTDQRQRNRRFLALGVQPTQRLRCFIFATAAHQRHGICKCGIRQLTRQFDQRAADRLIVRVQLPCANPFLDRRVFVIALLVPDGLTDVCQRILRVHFCA